MGATVELLATQLSNLPVETDLVTVSIGGNDAGFPRVGLRWGKSRVCSTTATGSSRSTTEDTAGRPPPPDYSFDAFLGDLRVVLKETAPRDSLLCGWSFGADPAIWYGADHPQSISGVIALDGGIPAEPMRLDEDQLRRQRDGTFGRAMRRLMMMLGVGVYLTTAPPPTSFWP